MQPSNSSNPSDFAARYDYVLSKFSSGNLNTDEVIQQLLRLAQDARHADRWGEHGIAMNGIGVICVFQSRLDDGLSFYDLALKSHQRAGNVVGEAQVNANIGAIRMQMGDFEQAYEIFVKAQEAIDILQTDDALIVRTAAVTYQAAALLNLNRQSEAQTILDKGFELLPEKEKLTAERSIIRMNMRCVEHHLVAAAFYLEKRDQERSTEAVSQGIDYARCTGDRYLGQAYRAAGDLRTVYPSADDKTPDEYYALSMERFDQARMQTGIAHTHIAQGFSHAARESFDQARNNFTRAYGIFASYNLKFKVNWARDLINAIDAGQSLPRHFVFG